MSDNYAAILFLTIIILILVGQSISVFIDLSKGKKKRKFINDSRLKFSKEFGPESIAVFDDLIKDLEEPYAYELKNYENSILEVKNHNSSIDNSLLMKENINLEQDQNKKNILLSEYESYLIKNDNIINGELNHIEFTEKQNMFLVIKSKFREFRIEYDKI